MYNILAIYAPLEGNDQLIRHVATSTSAEMSQMVEDRIRDLPKGAAFLAGVVYLPHNNVGFKHTMKRVNVGTPGVPA